VKKTFNVIPVIKVGKVGSASSGKIGDAEAHALITVFNSV